LAETIENANGALASVMHPIRKERKKKSEQKPKIIATEYTPVEPEEHPDESGEIPSPQFEPVGRKTTKSPDNPDDKATNSIDPLSK
jgi:hypothetical protein